MKLVFLLVGDNGSNNDNNQNWFIDSIVSSCLSKLSNEMTMAYVSSLYVENYVTIELKALF